MAYTLPGQEQFHIIVGCTVVPIPQLCCAALYAVIVPELTSDREWMHFGHKTGKFLGWQIHGRWPNEQSNKSVTATTGKMFFFNTRESSLCQQGFWQFSFCRSCKRGALKSPRKFCQMLSFFNICFQTTKKRSSNNDTCQHGQCEGLNKKGILNNWF